MATTTTRWRRQRHAGRFNAAVGKVFNPSDKTGGTLKMANNGDWDSLDPADTYYGYSWDFAAPLRPRRW